ncbi:LOW QUALITY PROTEIN: dehydrodolichyl diphosphate synthase complex subunit nus1 [Drosophila sulfurigaster albostrigata]|uniref:LOW QUALITY PROTEIN: dehydrodolichyl diphosphate synthase complex subunit nus1 n=1 Tax=Drosophila sulfurigaster albostrigata TaxID=89887 RepID=UPI002D21DBDD|nr:LOW QUALITY PROTEIN: dehydrodolichyl diphosphate synthase complex subunit nus1 [Drosophila sulfurigaster albostrigata]
MMMQLLCLWIGQLLLLLVATYELLQLLWHRLQAFAHRSYDYWQCDRRQQNNRLLFERTIRELEKLPKHLVLVIGADERYVDASQLQRIFGYAQLVGIPYLSVYDARSVKKGYVDIGRFCQWSKDRLYYWPSQKQNKQQILEQNGNNKCVNANGRTIGELQVFQINALLDGHALIAKLCRELYVNRGTTEVQQLLTKRELLSDKLNERLNQELGIPVPEPELGIVFSGVTCTFGLLPWHARFTEFHTHPSGRHFDATCFAQLLYKYARCEQRWGK